MIDIDFDYFDDISPLLRRISTAIIAMPLLSLLILLLR
jgi:hypothetical protein